MRDKNSNSARNLCIDYLIFCYFGSNNDFLSAAIDKAYSDMASHTLHGLADVPDLKWKCRYDASCKLYRGIKCFSNSQKSFFDWHKDNVNEIRNVYERIKISKSDFSFSEGQAQKWLNMTIKYLFVLKEIVGLQDRRFDDSLRLFFEKTGVEFYFPPIDSYVLKGTEIEDFKHLSWSTDINKWCSEPAEKHDYKAIKEKMDNAHCDFMWELENWSIFVEKYSNTPNPESYAYYIKDKPSYNGEA